MSHMSLETLAQLSAYCEKQLSIFVRHSPVFSLQVINEIVRNIESVLPAEKAELLLRKLLEDYTPDAANYFVVGLVLLITCGIPISLIIYGFVDAFLKRK